jgi:hypothetical protein
MRTELSRGPIKTPVAIAIFNRPDLTRQVFAAIRAARPPRLLVIADGPRNPEERTRCEAARAVIQIDWPCELETNYAEANLGCKRRVASGLTWVFERCEEAIVLEDDTLPAPSFFPFCEALLARYRDDERVMCIGGMNLYPRSAARDQEDYYFVRYGATNGWASWRRAWRHFDVDLAEWPAYKRAGRLRDVVPTPRERWFWTALFDAQHRGSINTWDFQWLFARLARGGLMAAPMRNMVVNLGFRADATHSVDMPAAWAPAREHHDTWSIEHPEYVVANRDVDDYYYERLFNPLGLTGIALAHARPLLDRARDRVRRRAP